MQTEAHFQEFMNTAPETAAGIVRDLCRIPAPSHHEEKRSEYCRKWFIDNGFTDVEIDEALNVYALLNVKADNPVVVVMAHTDTVFPDMEPMPFIEENGWMHSPGVTDDTANLAVLMTVAKYFREQAELSDLGVVFAANSCEEGLGNLKGCRAIVERFGSRIVEMVSLDSANMLKVVTGAVGSHRWKVTVRTIGGHSFGNFGNPNAIHQLSMIINELYKVEVPHQNASSTTYNVGSIAGGTSVNTIAQSAEMLYEYRSDNRWCLAQMKSSFEQIIENFRNNGFDIELELLGERPCSGEIDPVKMADLLKRVKGSFKDVLNVDAAERVGSTDCNIPLSLGIPAICFGVCRGTGAHTREEKLEVASLSDGCRLLWDFLQKSYLNR